MKISFPYIGNGPIAFKYFIEELGHEAVVPPKPSKRTLSLGTQYAPEFACLPFKIILGTYIEVAEQGVDLIITSGGCGPCRAGLYGVLHQKILRDLGFKTRIMVLESVKKYPIRFLKNVHEVISPVGTSWLKFARKFWEGWEKLKALDETEQLSHEIRPYEKVKGATTKAYNEALKIIDAARGLDEIRAAKEEARKKLLQVPRDPNRNPLKVGIVGEIYVVIEPFANLDLQVALGEMGVATARHMYLKQWLLDNTGDGEEKISEWARPYLNEMIGGHAIFSVGEMVMYAKQGFDGVVQLAPFSCMPEISVKGILEKISRDFDMPVLTVFLDELTGKAGLQTRLEAFVDLLWQKREKKGAARARELGVRAI